MLFFVWSNDGIHVGLACIAIDATDTLRLIAYSPWRPCIDPGCQAVAVDNTSMDENMAS